MSGAPHGLIVEIAGGRVEGGTVGSLLVFRNLPYAHAARFRAPEPAAPWTGRRNARERGPICPQGPERLAFVTGGTPASFPQSEDCLNLTVTTPGLKGRRPVMVWIHGGAYMSGGGELPCHDAEKLSAEGDVVVVSLTYRLGVFGWLWHEEPARRNLGLLDQLAALDWVGANIERFGGDPDNVTVFGQSAGGGSIVAMLRVRPQGLPFIRAILQSTPIAARRRPEDAATFAAAFAAALGSDAERASVASILAAQRQAVITNTVGVAPMSPVLGDVPLQRSGLACLVGWNKDDGSPFVAMRTGEAAGPPWFEGAAGEATEAFTKGLQVDSAMAFAESTPADAHTYLYRLDWRPKGSPFGACHGLELPLLLGTEAAWRAAPMLGEESWLEIERRGRGMRAAWAAFARTGNPNTDASFDWRPYSDAVGGTVIALGT